ncbi:short-chain dehydrogenase/reductase SDR [Tepidicaulis marinus]|uniref:Short-chain dehydrogenase/reductase SDR n=1 Tax=Tepidicaulis marinus TaxID=1333998 RepID=A0A081BA80_9HYPH|nr:SDR family oxidoreductase [Tepidicaulis marinus]GAK44948.1 short-chain dehydrogenase/reductase SDR [Tepidicaulis marinus]
MELFDLKGKVALVTGSTKGIGKAIVTRMAEHGAKVVVSSRKADACDEVAAEINAKYPGQAIAVPCNIADKAQLQNLVDKTNEAFGKIDVLVCNAAVNPYFGPSKDIPDEAFDRIMSSNVKSNHWLCHMVLPQMQERKDGSIIIISSIGGLHGSSIIGAYCISKAADFQLARNLSVEFGKDNIRVNCIAPGLIQTYFAKALWDDPDILKQSTASAPLKRIGQPDEIAGAAVFLASKAGAFMTGQQMVIDGGVMIS